MLTIRKMNRSDVPMLYEIALRSFKLDYDKYGVYPPLINLKKKGFLPPLIFGNTILLDNEIIGGAFIVGLTKNGEIGAIFIDTIYQGKGYGRQVMLLIEDMHPKVKKWKLETPSESYELHKFYESLGYTKTKEILEPKSGMKGFVYEKVIL